MNLDEIWPAATQTEQRTLLDELGRGTTVWDFRGMDPDPIPCDGSDPLSCLVGRPGLEPGTLGLKVPCSSQMS